MKQDPAVYIISILFAAWVACIILIYRRHRAKIRRDYEQLAKEEQGTLQTDVRNAVVVSKSSDIVYTNRNPKHPKHGIVYTITFSVNGKQVTHEVSRQIYERVKKGQRGKLITVNGNFLDFDT